MVNKWRLSYKMPRKYKKTKRWYRNYYKQLKKRTKKHYRERDMDWPY